MNNQTKKPIFENHMYNLFDRTHFLYDLYFSFSPFDLYKVNLVAEIFKSKGIRFSHAQHSATNHLSTLIENFTQTSKELIDNSKAVLIFVSLEYTKSLYNMDELVYVSVASKPVFILMLDNNLAPESFGHFGLLLARLFTFNQLPWLLDSENFNANFHQWINEIYLKLTNSNENSTNFDYLNLNIEEEENKFDLTNNLNTIKNSTDLKPNRALKITKCFYLEKQILLFDSVESLIIKIDLAQLNDFKEERVNILDERYSLGAMVKELGCVCFNGRDFLVSDLKTQRIYLFDEGFKFLGVFAEKKIGLVNDMCFCGEDETLYVSNATRGLIEAYDFTTRLRSIKQYLSPGWAKFFNPGYLMLKLNFLFAVNKCHFETRLDKWKLKYRNCSDGVYLFDKRNLNFLRKVANPDWLQPIGLFVDDHMNLVTMSIEVLDEKMRLSNVMKMFKINKESSEGKKVELGSVAARVDYVNMFFVEKSRRVFIVQQDGTFKIVEFY